MSDEWCEDDDDGKEDENEGGKGDDLFVKMTKNILWSFQPLLSHYCSKRN